MKLNHRYIIAGILVIAIIITGTSAYDSVTGDRSVDVSVVENEDAYLAIKTKSLENGTTVPAFRLTNNLNREAELIVRAIERPGKGASIVNVTVNGESTSLDSEIDILDDDIGEVNIRCTDASKSYIVDLRIILETNDNDIEIDVNREYDLDCINP